MTVLYHATAKMHLASILAQGLLPGSYWTDLDELADYYRETVEDEEEPALLMVRLSDLEPAALAPDRPGIEEPISTVIALSEDEVWERWSRSEQTWQDSLEIVHSLCYERNIPAEHLCVVTDDSMTLADYLA